MQSSESAFAALDLGFQTEVSLNKTWNDYHLNEASGGH
jgi:hypothetical protein